MDLNSYMKGMRLANITFDFPKEWNLTRFVRFKNSNFPFIDP
jgi:hypothetical protein